MQLTTAPTAARPELPPIAIEFRPNPNYSSGARVELLASFGAGRYLDDTDRWVRPRWGVWSAEHAPVKAVAGSFEDAVRAARDLVATERRNAKWGFFGRHQDRVDALAVLEARQGWELFRVDVPLDAYRDYHFGPRTPLADHLADGEPRRERDGVAALVGENHLIDLRTTRPSPPTEPFHDPVANR